VLSPQYLIWLVPLIALVRGTRGLVAFLLLVPAMVVTQFWLTETRYGEYVEHARYRWAELVLMRNLLLVALLAVLVLPALRRRRYSAA